MSEESNPEPAEVFNAVMPPPVFVSPAKPTNFKEEVKKYGEVTLKVLTGADAMCYPNENDAEAYTHVELWLDLGDGNPVTPGQIGLPQFDPYFAPSGLGSFVSKEVAAELESALEARVSAA